MALDLPSLRDRLARRAHRSRGFSAAEMMVVVALIGLMVLVTTPALLNFFATMKARTASNRLASQLRLCRQVAVARRTQVLMEMQRTNGTTTPTFKAWEEKSSPANIVRDANGVDGTAGNDDDENWVVKPDKQMGIDGVTFLDSYNDTTPADPSDALGSSIMDGTGKMTLRFYPNGTVLRINRSSPYSDVGSPADTLIRMRLQRRVNNTRTDNQDVTINRAGKVGADFTKTG